MSSEQNSRNVRLLVSYSAITLTRHLVLQDDTGLLSQLLMKEAGNESELSRKVVDANGDMAKKVVDVAKKVVDSNTTVHGTSAASSRNRVDQFSRMVRNNASPSRETNRRDIVSGVSSTSGLPSSSGENGFCAASGSRGEGAGNSTVINCFLLGPTIIPAQTSKASRFLDVTLTHQSKTTLESNIHSKLPADGKPSANGGVAVVLEDGSAPVSTNGALADEGWTWNNAEAPTDDSLGARASNQGDLEWTPCVCGKHHDDSIHTFLIECSLCRKWFKVDTDCVGFDKREAQNIPSWVCLCCNGDEIPQDVAPELLSCDEDETAIPAQINESKGSRFMDPTIPSLAHQSKTSVQANIHSKVPADGKPSANVLVDMALENGSALVSTNGAHADEGETLNNETLEVLYQWFGHSDDAEAPIDSSVAARASNQNDSETQADFEWIPCVCGKHHDDSVGTFWIECSFCRKWSKVETDCVGFNQAKAETIPWVGLCCIGDESPQDIALLSEELLSGDEDETDSNS